MSQFPVTRSGPMWKDEPGEYRLEKRRVVRKRKATEQAVIESAKRRDHYRCRWPGCLWRDLRVEGAHATEHRGMGGDPTGERTQRHLIITLCLRHHKRFDAHRLDVVFLSERGTDGPLEFYESHKGELHLVARERTVGIPETRGV